MASPLVVNIYPTLMKANVLMKHNISHLLRQRGLSQKDLAVYCYRKESWISKIMTVPTREFPMKYFDRIAEFLGVTTHQLLQPGMSSLTERRSGIDRRSITDRRIAPGARSMLRVSDEIDAHHPKRRSRDAVASSPLGDTLKRLTAEYEKRVAALLHVAAKPRIETPKARGKITPPHKGHRVAGGSDAGKV